MVTSCCLCAVECVPFNPQRSFHRIPIDEHMRKIWFNIIGRIVSYKGARVCSDHFTEHDFHEMSVYSKIRRLRNTAIPTLRLKRNRKDETSESSLFQETNTNVSEIESQNDSEIESQNEKNVIYCNRIAWNCNTENCEDNTSSNVENKESKYVEQSSPILNVTENLVNVPLDSERKINTIFINDQKDVDDNFVNKNDINGKRKLPSSNLENSKHKIFVHMSRYNREFFRKIDFSSDKKWLAFKRYVAYNRHQNKVLTQRNRRLHNKIDALQGMLKDLM